MTDTTIRVSDDVVSELKTRQKEGESYNATLRRILELEEGELRTEQEVRSIAREEAEVVIREHMRR